MSYTIKQTNGNVLTTIPDTQLVKTFAGLTLFGANYPSVGTVLNTDLVRIVENFASSVSPTNPLVGQFWYDTTENKVKYWNGTSFKQVSVLTTDSTAPSDAQEGDQWFDTNTNQLYIYHDYTWILIGPDTGNVASTEGWITEIFTNSTANIYYEELLLNGNVGIIASTQNIDTTYNPITGFSNIRAGLNFVTSPVSGEAEGGVYNATELTLGNGDQFALTTDADGNGDIYSFGNITQINTMGNTTANAYAYQQFINGNITGLVYMNELMARNINVANNMSVTGNITITGNISVPGSDHQVLYNNNGNLGATGAISVFANSMTQLNGTISALGDTFINANLNITGMATFNANTANSFSMPKASRGTSGQALVSNGDGTTSWGLGNVPTISAATYNYYTRPPYLVNDPESYSAPLGSSSIFQNTSNLRMLVTVSADGGGGGFHGVVYCDANQAPTTAVAKFCRVNAGSSNPNWYPGSVTFMVPPGYYYSVSCTNSGGVISSAMYVWTEWIF